MLPPSKKASPNSGLPPANHNLVIQTAYWGDLLLAIPLLKLVKSMEPDIRLVLACRSGFGSFMRDLDLAHEIVEVDKKDQESVRKFPSALKQWGYQTVYSGHESFRTATIVWSIRAKTKIGFSNLWSFWAYENRVSRIMSRPDAVRQILLAAPRVVGLAEKLFEQEDLFRQFMGHDLPASKVATPKLIPEWLSMKVDIPLARRDLQSADLAVGKVIEGGKPLILFAPGSQWETKRWTTSGFTDLAKKIVAGELKPKLSIGGSDSRENSKFSIVLVGTSSEINIGNEIESEVPEVINLIGKTRIIDLYWLMKSAQLLVCNDSGSMHLASVAGLPTVAIFGPTVRSQGYGPWQNQAAVVESDLSCRPCGSHGHHKCPINTHDCMKKITGAHVLQALKKLI